MARVFISYKRQGSILLAELIRSELAARNISAFLDTHNMNRTGPFPNELRREIEDCEVFVCLLAQDTLRSEWVTEEIKQAVSLGKTLIPVFQEGYISSPEPQEYYIETLCLSNGVDILDRQSKYIPEAIKKLVSLIESAKENGSRQSPKRWFPRITMKVELAIKISVALSLTGVLLVVLTQLAQEPRIAVSLQTETAEVQAGTRIAGQPTYTPTLNTPFSQTETAEARVGTGTPTAVSTPPSCQVSITNASIKNRNQDGTLPYQTTVNIEVQCLSDNMEVWVMVRTSWGDLYGWGPYDSSGEPTVTLGSSPTSDCGLNFDLIVIVVESGTVSQASLYDALPRNFAMQLAGSDIKGGGACP